MEKTVLDTLWIEKYRPKTLDELVLDEGVKSKFREFIEDGEIPHILLCGTAGIGKTSLVKILLKELDCEYKNINASVEGGIDTVRSEIKSFATSASFDGKTKIVVLSEASGLSKNAQDSLKDIVEDCSETTRFIFTANELHKLTEPIISRCQTFDLTYSLKDFVKRCSYIVKAEKLDVDKEDLANLVKLCKAHFPDFRKTIGEIHKSVSGDQLIITEKSLNTFIGDLWSKLKEPPEAIRKFYIEESAQFGSYNELISDMAKYAFENLKPEFSRKMIKLFNDYLVQDAMVVDKELNFYCMIIELTSSKTK